MLTVKSVLTGALVFGAATLPAGVVVSDLATNPVPEAPDAIVVEAPAMAPTDLIFQETFVSAVLSPPRPAPVVGVEAPRADGPDLALEEMTLKRVSIVPPAGTGSDRI